MNKHLFPKAEFAALLGAANEGNASREEVHKRVWFAIADRIRSGWHGVSYSFLLDGLTSGQEALVCCAHFYRCLKAADFISAVTGSSELCLRTLKALEVIEAQEYWRLLRQVQEVFPGKKFPEYAEDIMAAVRKQPANYFDK